MRKALLATVAAVCGAAGVSSAATVWAIDQHNTLFSFDSANPSVITTAKPLALPAGQQAVGIDFRPADGQLYVMSNTGELYTAGLASGGNTFTATNTGTPVTGLNGTSFGFDFNPQADRLRVTSDTDINLSHQVGGATTAQTALTAPYGNPAIVGSAYSNNFAGTTSTTLYNIDAGNDSLTIQNPPAGGVQAVVGSLGVDVRSEELGFDIESGTNVAFLAANPGGQRDSNLYTVNLASGAATNVGLIGQGILVRDIAVVIPEPTTLSLVGLAGMALRRRR